VKLTELKKKYRNVPLVILRKYQEQDKYVRINSDDKDLAEIKFLLPPIPDLKKIHGFGLKSNNQIFEHEEYPANLRKLTNVLLSAKRIKSSKPQEVFLTIEEIWIYLNNHRQEYKDSIKFIELQWYYRLYGKWYFINGKPTYLNGWHWFYLNYYHLLTGKLPDYRDRDRRWFLIQKFIYEETTDEHGVNLERRLHLGTNNLDGRRFGKTSRAASIHLNLITMHKNWEGGIQGMNQNNGEIVFQRHVIYPFKKNPFFFKPVHEGSTDMKTKLVLKPSAIIIGSKGTFIDDRVGLDSSVDYAPTADKTYYDKRRLNIIHVDEPGKTKLEDVAKRHGSLKECVAQGTEVVGWMMYTTTVEETTSDAMESYSKICDGSHYDERENGQTSTGLVNIFISSADGLEGFIDIYGNSVMETPSHPIMGINKKLIRIGSKEYINTKRTQFIKNKDFDGLSAFKRKFPLTYRECFTPSAEDVNFNREIMETRISELKFDKDATMNGDLLWVKEFGGHVIFIARTDKKGKWFVSRKPLGDEANRIVVKNEQKYPMNPHYTISADPFKFNKTKRKGSDGGISVFIDYDAKVDDGKDVSKWISHDFVADYEFRANTTEEFSEEVLKAAIYWSGMVYPERNVDNVIKDLERWGFGGYLLYDIFVGKNGFTKISTTAGYNNSGEAKKMNLMHNMRDYIQLHGKRCNHINILNSAMELKGIKDMTNKDLFVAACLGLEGTKSKFKELRKDIEDEVDLDSIYPKY
jgi:hypothetical protein